jgi:hypothetical protein
MKNKPRKEMFYQIVHNITAILKPNKTKNNELSLDITYFESNAYKFEKAYCIF